MTRRGWTAVVVVVVAAAVVGAVLLWPDSDAAPGADDEPTVGPTASATPVEPSATPPPLASLDPPATQVAAIVAALRQRRVSGPLRPDPDDALADGPAPVWTNGCQAAQEVVDQPPCVYGDPAGSRTVVLFGDSHAGQLFPALHAAARAGGWRLVSWTKVTCPVSDLPVDSRALGRRYTECETWRDRTVRRIGALRPDAVVVSQTEQGQPPQVSPRRFAVSTLRTLRRLEAATGAPVSYVQDTPTPGTDAPACADREDDADLRRCAFRAEDAYRDRARHDGLAAVLGRAGVEVVPVQGWFCARGRCPVVVGDVLVYRDPDHVSNTYMTRLGPLAAAILSRRAAR